MLDSNKNPNVLLKRMILFYKTVFRYSS